MSIPLLGVMCGAAFDSCAPTALCPATANAALSAAVGPGGRDSPGASAASGKAVAAAALLPAHQRYKTQREVLDKRAARPLQPGDVVVAGDALVSGRPTALLVSVATEEDLLKQARWAP
jgi:hypothetical protein